MTVHSRDNVLVHSPDIVTRPIAVILVFAFGGPLLAQDDVIRRRLDAPVTISGVSCDRTGRAWAEFFPSGALRSCPLAADTVIASHSLTASSWITLDESRRLRSAWLSRDTRLAGHLCHGTGYKGFAVTFHDDESLHTCYLARDTVINGVPCVRGSFWTEIRGGTKSVARFHPDGSLAGCQLSRDVVIDGVRHARWSRISRP